MLSITIRFELVQVAAVVVGTSTCHVRRATSQRVRNKVLLLLLIYLIE